AAGRGEAAIEYERGWLTDSGGLVSLPQGEPVAGRSRSELEHDLRSSTAALVVAASRALAGGAADRVAHVNPYFGPLTPLGCLQMAAVHARHHSRHLAEIAQRTTTTVQHDADDTASGGRTAEGGRRRQA